MPGRYLSNLEQVLPDAGPSYITLSSRGLQARGDPLGTGKRRDKSLALCETRWIAASVTTFPPRNDKSAYGNQTAHFFLTSSSHREGTARGDPLGTSKRTAL